MTTDASSTAPSGGSYVVFPGAGLELAIDTRYVREIVREEDWRGAAPVDVARLWGLPVEAEAGETRVLVIDAGGDASASLGVRAGRIAYRTFAGVRVSPLPQLMSKSLAARLVSGVVFDDGGPPLVVLNPLGLTYVCSHSP
jgi:hypothetical protein